MGARLEADPPATRSDGSPTEKAGRVAIITRKAEWRSERSADDPSFSIVHETTGEILERLHHRKAAQKL